MRITIGVIAVTLLLSSPLSGFARANTTDGAVEPDGADGEIPTVLAVAPGARPAPAPAPNTGTVVDLAVESSVDREGLLWVGGAVTGCMRWGSWCLGGVLRASDSRPRALSPVGHKVGSAWDAMATVAFPARVGTLVLVPSLDVGWGYVKLRDLDHRGYAGDGPVMTVVWDEQTIRGVRAGGRLSAAQHIGKGVSLVVTVAADTLYAGPDGDDVRVPDQRTHVRASLGLRVGGFGE